MPTFTFTDLGDGKTRMVFNQSGGNLPEEEYRGAAKGTESFFERLAEHLARG